MWIEFKIVYVQKLNEVHTNEISKIYYNIKLL